MKNRLLSISLFLAGVNFLLFAPLLLKAQSTNTILGDSALPNVGQAKYPISSIIITSQSGYVLPTIHFNDDSNLQIEDSYIQAYSNYGFDGYLNVSTPLNSPLDLVNNFPTVVGGLGNGATLYLDYTYVYNNRNYYEFYTDNWGTGYAPAVSLSSIAGSPTLYSYIDNNSALKIYYYDGQKTNTYTSAPTVTIQPLGSATATANAVLSSIPVNGENTAIGYQSLNNTSGGENTAVGANSGLQLTTGVNNTFIGAYSGNGITTGSNNTILGKVTSGLNPTLNNSVMINDGNGNTRFYSSPSGNVFIGYGNNPTERGYKLEVNGSAYFNSAISIQYLGTRSGIYFNGNRYGQPDTQDFLQLTYADGMHFRALPNFNYVLSLYKTGDSRFYGRVKGINGIDSDDFITKGQLDANDANLIHKVGDGSITGNLSAANLSGTNTGDETTASLQTKLNLGTAAYQPALSYTPYNPVAYPVNSGGETLKSVTDRNNTTSNYITAGSLYVNSGGYTLAVTRSSSNGLIGTTSNIPLGIMVNSTERVSILTNGNVGIDTTTPTEKFAVNGFVKSKGIKVDPNGFPDFVFLPDYRLRSLGATAQYIKQFGHLPEIPSASEVEKEGLELGDMTKRLLQKIEELTLYMIELKNDNTNLAEEVKQLKELVVNRD